MNLLTTMDDRIKWWKHPGTDWIRASIQNRMNDMRVTNFIDDLITERENLKNQIDMLNSEWHIRILLNNYSELSDRAKMNILETIELLLNNNQQGKEKQP